MMMCRWCSRAFWYLISQILILLKVTLWIISSPMNPNPLIEWCEIGVSPGITSSDYHVLVPRIANDLTSTLELSCRGCLYWGTYYIDEFLTDIVVRHYVLKRAKNFGMQYTLNQGLSLCLCKTFYHPLFYLCLFRYPPPFTLKKLLAKSLHLVWVQWSKDLIIDPSNQDTSPVDIVDKVLSAHHQSITLLKFWWIHFFPKWKRTLLSMALFQTAIISSRRMVFLILKGYFPLPGHT
jgi:hypothetical protein